VFSLINIPLCLLNNLKNISDSVLEHFYEDGSNNNFLDLDEDNLPSGNQHKDSVSTVQVKTRKKN
jgi:hypothetical protein